MQLKKLTDEQIEQLANKHFGNAVNYLGKEIAEFARDIEKLIQGKNK